MYIPALRSLLPYSNVDIALRPLVDAVAMHVSQILASRSGYAVQNSCIAGGFVSSVCASDSSPYFVGLQVRFSEHHGLARY